MGGQFVTVLILSIISSVGSLQDVASAVYGGEKCVPFQGRDEREGGEGGGLLRLQCGEKTGTVNRLGTFLGKTERLFVS